MQESQCLGGAIGSDTQLASCRCSGGEALVASVLLFQSPAPSTPLCYIFAASLALNAEPFKEVLKGQSSPLLAWNLHKMEDICIGNVTLVQVLQCWPRHKKHTQDLQFDQG